MYEIVLFIHSWVRWLVLILGLIVITRSFYGWINEIGYGKSDNLLSASLTGLFHTQLLLGLLLYFVLSPLTESVLSDFGKVMNDPALRFWAIEHILVMTCAVIVAQVGRTRIKKAGNNVIKFRTQSIYFMVALVLVLSRIPWHDSRRLFRGFSN